MMLRQFDAEQYQLLDFGQGRKLELFGPWLLDRPAPAAQDALPQRPEAWRGAVRFIRDDGQSGRWLPEDAMPPAWTIEHPRFRLDLKATEFGHVGVFPEQAENWAWISEQVVNAARPLNVLNLFAYTGGSTLAAVVAGAAVTHVDAASNVVAWARRNAALSGLAERPIRWIAEDATKFVRREIRRGRRYDAVILDPPSYGHGPSGEVWNFADGIGDLLQLCRQVMSGKARFLLLTCHTAGIEPEDAAQCVRRSFAPAAGGALQAGVMQIEAEHGASLSAGVYVRWSAPQRARRRK